MRELLCLLECIITYSKMVSRSLKVKCTGHGFLNKFEGIQYKSLLRLLAIKGLLKGSFDFFQIVYKHGSIRDELESL